MYFANMFCYGHDNDLVGITGIRGCMGLIYVGAVSMYAVHIPPNTAELDALGGRVFADWVKNQEGKTDKGYLFAFVNGSNRTNAKDEIKKVKKALNSPPTALYRINKHLGPQSGRLQAESVVIMLERVHATTTNPSGCAVWFKSNEKVIWQTGGQALTGQYKTNSSYTSREVPSDLEANWWRMDDMTTTCTEI